MLTAVSPKLPMRNKAKTMAFYVQKLGFTPFGSLEHEHYLMVEKDAIQLHFFLFEALEPSINYGQIYIRTNDIDGDYKLAQARGVASHAGGRLEVKPWGQKEFSVLDPDSNLLTFGQNL